MGTVLGCSLWPATGAGEPNGQASAVALAASSSVPSRRTMAEPLHPEPMGNGFSSGVPRPQSPGRTGDESLLNENPLSN